MSMRMNLRGGGMRGANKDTQRGVLGGGETILQRVPWQDPCMTTLLPEDDAECKKFVE